MLNLIKDAIGISARIPETSGSIRSVSVLRGFFELSVIAYTVVRSCPEGFLYDKKSPPAAYTQQGDSIKGEDKYFFFLW